MAAASSLHLLHQPRQKNSCVKNASTFSTSSESTNKPNYYELLNVRPDASAHDIKCAYLQKCKQLHPDRNMGSASKEDFQRVKHAYDVLRSAPERKRYDTWCAIYASEPVPITFEQYQDGYGHHRRGYTAKDYYDHYGHTHPYHQYPHGHGHQSTFRFWARTARKKKPHEESEDANHEQKLESNGSEYDPHQRFMRMIYVVCALGFATIFIYYYSMWLIFQAQNRALDNMVPKDELAKSFLRQSHMSGMRNDPVQQERLAQLLGENIDEAQRRRQEETKIVQQMSREMLQDRFSK